MAWEWATALASSGVLGSNSKRRVSSIRSGSRVLAVLLAMAVATDASSASGGAPCGKGGLAAGGGGGGGVIGLLLGT